MRTEKVHSGFLVIALLLLSLRYEVICGVSGLLLVTYRALRRVGH